MVDTSNFDEDDKRPLPIGENKKVTGLMKYELAGKIMTEFCGLRAKTYAYLMDDDSEKKKAKGTKTYVIKISHVRKLQILFNNKIILTTQQRFKSDHYEVYTEEVSKIVLSSNDDKRLQTLDSTKTYPHRTNAFKKCESQIMMVRYLFVKNYAN